MSSLLGTGIGIFAKEILSHPSIELFKEKILSNIDIKANSVINRNQRNVISKIFNRYTFISIILLLSGGFGYYYYRYIHRNKNVNLNKFSSKFNEFFLKLKKFT